MHLIIADMPIVPLFLLKLSVSLGLVWAFYQVVLRRMTFYGLNRWYLLGYTLISFFIPLINIGPMMADRPAGEPVLLQFIPAIGGLAGRVAPVPAIAGGGVSLWTVLLWILAVGAAALLVRFALRWVSLTRLRHRARLIPGLGVKVYQVDGQILPFSFGNSIYINQQLHTEKEWEDIVLHEYVHVRQRHTIDILIAELVCIANWYNPFAWLIRYSIRQNLEFIADQEVLNKGVDRKGYQYHLLKVVGEPQYRLANNFNFSSLRKRIVMMNKMRSARVQLLKLLFLLPLVAVLLVAFRDKGAKLFGSGGTKYVNAAGIAINGPDRRPLEGVVVREQESGLQTTTDAEGYYKLQIPLPGRSVKLHLDYTKPGYDTDTRTYSIPNVMQTIGLLDVAVLRHPDAPHSNLFIAPSMMIITGDPTYEDAKKDLVRVLNENDDLNRYMQLEKEHPEIGLFYMTEDRRKEVVVYMNGTIERYGYPGTPGLDELYKKYGQIDNYMATDHPNGHQVNSGYLARWAAIGEQAQREFHNTNPNARAIIFPGDSRVIGVPVSGKPQVYDMDNDAGKERAEFERLYGKLPSCVPGAGFNSDEMERKAGWPASTAPKDAKDTVPGRGDTLGHPFVEGAVRSLDTASPLYIVDGKKMPAGWGIGAVPSAMIRDVNVIKDKTATAVYGDLGKNGVILVNTKDPGHDWSKGHSTGVGIKTAGTVTLPGTPDRHPLIIIGGREVPYDTLQSINQDSIASIDVLKDFAFLKRPEFVKKYGDKGKDGVLVIHMKNEKKPLCLVDGKELSLDAVKAMDQNEIESINVLKDEAARAIYGEKGKNGVIIVTLKKKSSMIGHRESPDGVLVAASQ